MPFRGKLALFLAIALASCSTHVDSKPANPDAAKLDQFAIPFDANLPTFNLLIELQRKGNSSRPIFAEPDKSKYTCIAYNGPEEAIAAIMRSAFVGVRNFSIMDTEGLRYSALPPVRHGEHGYFIVRTTLTELSDSVEKKESGLGMPDLKEGDSAALSAGKIALMAPFFWFSQLTLLPTQVRESFSKSAIAIDTAIINQKTGEVLTSYTSRGTFSEKSSSFRAAAGVSKEHEEYSVAEGAIRAAAQDAAKHAYEFLTAKYRL